MGFRFHKSVKIAPGFRLNISKKGLGVSAGVKGAHVSAGPTGVRRTLSIPGTGISHIQKIGPHLDKDQVDILNRGARKADHGPDHEEYATDRNNNIIPGQSKNLVPILAVVAGLVLLCSMVCLAGTLISAISPKPTQNVNDIVSTAVAQMTQEAVIPPTPFQPATALPVVEQPVAEQPMEDPTADFQALEPTAQGLIPVTDGDKSIPLKQACCKHCSKGKACGDVCIPQTSVCTAAPGCACDR